MVSGRFGEVIHTQEYNPRDPDMFQGLWDYHIAIPTEHGIYQYDWRVFEKYDKFTVKLRDYITPVWDEERTKEFDTLEEAIAYADDFSESYTEEAVQSLLDTFGNKSAKKSQDIHSMIAQIRQNNNSLVKSRIDIHKGIRSVGQSYNLDIDRISNEILQIIIDSKQSNGDYALDEYGAYDKWCDENYNIESFDEYGDSDYNSDIIDAVEDKFYDYKDKLESELMNKIYDLEYNDLVEFAGYGEVYVKSTNGNDSYEGCKIWAGPDKDDDMGGYYYASDFVRVVEHSNSGEHIFNW